MAGTTYNIQAVIKAVDRFTGPLRTMGRRASRVASAVKRSFGGIGRIAGLLGGVGVVGGLYKAVEATMDLEDALALLRSMPGMTEEALTRMHKSGIAWSEKHGNSVEQYLGAAYETWSAGITDAGKAIAATEEGIKSGKIARGDAIEATKALGTLYNTAGNQAADATEEFRKMGIVLASTQQTFQISNLQQFTDGLSYAIRPGLDYGVSLNEIASAMGVLNTSSIAGASAGTGFRMTLAKLTTASKDLGFEIVRTAEGGINLGATMWNLKGALGQLKPETVGDRMQRAFGSRAAASAGALARMSGEIGRFAETIDNYGAQYDKSFSDLDATTRSKLAIVTQRLRRAGAAIGGRLVEMIEPYIPKIEALIERIPAAFEWIAGVVSDIKGFVDALGGVKTIIAGIAVLKLVPVIAALGTAGGMIAGIALAIGSVVWAIDQLKDREEEDRRRRHGLGVDLTRQGARERNVGQILTGARLRRGAFRESLTAEAGAAKMLGYSRPDEMHLAIQAAEMAARATRQDIKAGIQLDVTVHDDRITVQTGGVTGTPVGLRVQGGR